MVPQHKPGLLLRVPPPVWTLAFLLIAYGIDRAIDTPVLVYSDIAAAVLIMAGFGIAMWSGATFTRAGTELQPTSEVNAKLVTYGPFRYMRNPMYTGLLLVSLGIALHFGTVWFFLVPVILFLLLNATFIPYEEGKMERQFGAQFRDYKSRTPRWGIV